MESLLSNKIVMGVGSAVTVLVAGVLCWNYVAQKKLVPLKKDILVKILKYIRRQNYTTLSQLMPMVQNFYKMNTMAGQITPEILQLELNSEHSGILLGNKLEKNKVKAMGHFSTDVDTFNASLEALAEDEELESLKQTIANDYKQTLSGKPIRFKVKVPAGLTPEGLLKLFEETERVKFLEQIRLMKKLQHLSEEEQQDPVVMGELGAQNPTLMVNNLLEENGFGNEEEPANAVFEASLAVHKNNFQFAKTISAIAQVFGKTFQKYIYKMQTNSATPKDLDDLQNTFLNLKVTP